MANRGQFKKGQAKGRPKGAVNKLTKSVREVVLTVFNELQDDPDANMAQWAKRDPAEFYKIASKLIPTELTGGLNNTITVNVTD